MSKRVNGSAIGIDLGTTYSCAAICLSRKKRVEIIPNEQGNRITPSCVAFSDSELLVGESAKYQIARNPANTVFDVKRLIGNRFSDPQVQNDMKMWPFKVMKGDSDKPSVVVEFKDAVVFAAGALFAAAAMTVTAPDMSGDKNENKNIVYRDVAASLSSYQCPVLNNTNYTLWAFRMKKILLANGVWDLVEGTTREIWDSLKSRFFGTEDVQQAHSQQFKSEFETLVMKEDESIDLFAGKLMSIITKAAICGLTFDEQTKVRKVLNAVPNKFVPVVATIEMTVDFKTIKLEEIIRNLKTYEERIKFRKGSQEDNSEKLFFTCQGNDRNYERNYGNDRRGRGNQTRRRPRKIRMKFQKKKIKGIRSEIEIDLKSKLELWKLGILQEIEMEKQEFEKKIRNIEMAFEKQMQRELENLKKLRDYTSKKMKKLKTEREQFERENHEVVSDKKHLEEEPSVDKGECKKHRETPSRFQKENQIEKDIKSSNKKVDPEDRDTSTKRNRLFEIQNYEMKQMKEDSDKGNKDARDEVEDKEER
nr:heat shock cognate 70 kDa protein-like [Tanacetum cinerariifolium]